jgi:nicotinamidase-related amidase
MVVESNARTMGARRTQTEPANGASSAGSLHGNAPDSSAVAVLLIDIINDLEFPGGEKLAARARPIISKLDALRSRARRAKVPIIYANDNFGRWRSDFSAQVDHCSKEGVRGRELVRVLRPGPEDYFVLKPKHSAFYQTCLELLLEHLGVETLIIGGLSTDSCVTFTASDAYLRGFGLRVLSDGCAAMDARLHRDALAHMQRALHAELVTSSEVSLRPQAAGGRSAKRKTKRAATAQPSNDPSHVPE